MQDDRSGGEPRKAAFRGVPSSGDDGVTRQRCSAGILPLARIRSLGSRIQGFLAFRKLGPEMPALPVAVDLNVDSLARSLLDNRADQLLRSRHIGATDPGDYVTRLDTRIGGRASRQNLNHTDSIRRVVRSQRDSQAAPRVLRGVLAISS